MSTDSAVSILWDVLKYVVVRIKRQFGYVMSSKSYVNDLQEEVQKLANESQRVHILAEVASNNLRNFYGGFTEWQTNAENALKEARDLLGIFEQASKTCCYGTLPDPNCRYRFSRQAKVKIEAIRQLAQKCSEFKELNDISFSDPAPGNVTAPTPARSEGKDIVQSTTTTTSTSSSSTSITLKDDGLFESRVSIIRDIMEALADNSNSVVGVHGMGGVGKSTLLADAERRIKEEKLFDWITKADVSENPDIKRIQGEIAYWLGLSDIKKEDDVSLRAKLLRERLEDEERKKKKVLIILDNLWEQLNLKLVGIPCGNDNKVSGCKLLLTARDQRVLRREMRCDKDFLLGELKEEEAKRLFKTMVGGKVHVEFEPLMDEALRISAGLPFLILAMAKLFIDTSLSECKDALKQIENKEISEVINKTLQLSYDHIKSKDAKSLLRLCAVYGVSEPSLENLVRYGVGLGLFGEDSSMEDARNRLSSLIHTLQASSLLLHNEEDGFKIHDLVRGFVASVTSRDDPLLVLKDNKKSVVELPKDKLKSCTAICFPYVDMKELPEELDCPELRIFLLFTNNESLKVPDSLFSTMRKLMILNLIGIRLAHSPSSFQLLEKLHTLCLDGCSIDDVTILGELKGLRILSFLSSKIQRLPKEIGQLTELRLLDLTNCRQLEIIEPGVLGNLIKLEELYMLESFHHWNVVDQTPPTNASLIELNNMKNLCTLHVFILDSSVLPQDLNVEKLTKYLIRIGELWRWSRHKGSRTLEIKLNPISNILHTGCIRTALDKIDDLYLDGLNGIEQSICELSPEGFPKLKYLHVQNNPSIHYIIGRLSLPAFKMLESLLLDNFINLEKICHGHISSMSFRTLKVVLVKSCPKMEVLFPLSLLRKLPQLEEIRVIDCNFMREIVEADDHGKVELRNLHKLELHNLPNIKNFVTARTAPLSSTLDGQVGTQVAFFNGQQVSIPSLESLSLSGLPKLKSLWSDEFPLGLSNLRSLTIGSCKSLSKVINSKSLVKLHKLHTLTIYHCDSVEEIFDLDVPNASGNVETLFELTTLKLNYLESLRHIWNKNACEIVRFHNLQRLEVSGCDNLLFMFFSSMVESLAKLRDLKVHNCDKMEAIIMEEEGSRMETLETLAFPLLTNLELSDLESLTCFSRGKCSRKVRSQDHVKSRFNVLFDQEVSIPSLEYLSMSKLSNLKYLWSDEFPLGLSNLQSLVISSCKSLSKVINSELLVKLHKLHTLTIKYCDSLEEIFYLDVPNASGNVGTFSELTTLKLSYLVSLRHIWNKNPCEIVRFHNLQQLKVSQCDNLWFIFFPSMVKSLAKLRVLEVRYCNKMEAIIMEEEGSRMETSETLAFPMLTHVELSNLESLTCFSRGKCSRKVRSQDHVKTRFNVLFDQEVVFPSLETLKIFAMDNIEVIWDNQAYFRHLKTLVVSLCRELSHIFTSTIAENLVELTELRISNCIMLAKVIVDEGGKEGHVVAFKQLKYLELDQLIGLRCLSLGEHTLMFPLLKDVIVSGCPNMKFFSEGPIETPKLDGVQVTKHERKFWKENLNFTIRNMFEGMAKFARVKTIRLSEFPESIGKWHSELIPNKSSWQLESLMVDQCPSFINAIPSSLMLILNQMSKLHVRDCELLEEIFDLEGLEGVESTWKLPSFMTLDLVNLPKLRRLWNKDLQGSLPSHFLRNLTLYKCSNLRHAFAPSMARCLANLTKIEIKECGQMEGVIAEDEGLRNTVKKITFPELRNMKLECLPNLTCFFSGNNHALDCPELRSLTIAHCPKMRSLISQSSTEIDNGTPSLFTPQVQFPRLNGIVLSHIDNLSKIWTDDPQEALAFENLRSLEVNRCKSLENIFPHWLATSLNKLQTLQVESCGLEEIVVSGDETPHSTTAQVLFLKLTSLVLHDMPRLKSFCTTLPTLNWSSLQELRVTHCDKLNMSFVAPMNKWPQRDDKRDLSNQEAHASFQRDFPNVKRLLLVEKDIEMIRDGKLPDDIFGKTEALTLACFHDENAVFPSRFLLERFEKLQSLEVFCSSFEAIFPDEGLVDEEKHPVLENLRELKLSKLHNLKRVWREEDYLVAKILQSIKTFEVWDCLGLTTIFPAVTSFQNLMELVVKNSTGLVHLVTVSAITNLVHLTDITIIGCERMKEVVINDGNGEGKVISLGKLESLTLQHLPSLECFSSTTSYISGFPSLREIKVEDCPKMKMFSKGRLHTPKLRFAILFRYDWDVRSEGNLNTAIQKLSA
ncbi:uncharacterized protein LOC115691921 [Syzygium oleosum]|uniref:uncharacterized protein LOC115691921 n=1 Tax=Syzygium oleosum TaxID=219896 RepID=UPI0024BBC9B7|nr:uncharacterized protein LOC115691921 [Syzygium oleosum]